MAIGDRDRAEGTWDRAKGKAKKIVGELTDDPATRIEGSIDKAKGTLKQKKGDLKEDVARDLDNL